MNIDQECNKVAVSVTDSSRRNHYVRWERIRRISEAGPNGQGIRCYIVMDDGLTISCTEEAESVLKRLDVAVSK